MPPKKCSVPVFSVPVFSHTSNRPSLMPAKKCSVPVFSRALSPCFPVFSPELNLIELVWKKIKH